MSAWYEALAARIHDEDMIFVKVDLGFRRFFDDLSVRLNGINAPESRSAEGKASLACLETLIGPGVAVNVQTFHDPLDKYGRWLADVYRASDGSWLNNAMLVSGHAVVYKPEGAATN